MDRETAEGLYEELVNIAERQYEQRGQKCSKCGKPLVSSGGRLHCPTCGDPK